VNPIPEALRPELVAPITEAIIAADPTAEAQIITAASTGMGMAASQVAQAFWPDVTLLWVVIGTGPHALIRYVACPADGSLHVLTQSPDAFDAVAAQSVIEVSVDAALEYALFFLEVTRSMNQATEVVVSDQVSLAHLSRVDLVKAMLFGRNGLSTEQRVEALSRLHRIRDKHTSKTEIYAALETIIDAMTADANAPFQHTVTVLMSAGFSSADVRRLTILHRLPPDTLTPGERALLSRCLEALAPDIQANYAVLLSESDVFGSLGFIESRDSGRPVCRLGQNQLGYMGGVFPESMLGIQRCPKSGEVLQMNAEWGVLLTCKPPAGCLSSASIAPELWDDLDDFELMRNGHSVDHNHRRDDRMGVSKNRNWIPFEWNAALYDIDGLGSATPVMKFSVSEGQWATSAQVEGSAENTPQEWTLATAVRRVLTRACDGPVVRVSGHKFIVETLVCRDDNVDLCQLLIGGDGTIHASWSPVI